MYDILNRYDLPARLYRFLTTLSIHFPGILLPCADETHHC